ncbi:MAG: transcription-repair coupling factor [Muribaculaceae bacterium]|nr:transcription-repair coupling factor [Muribaculaceae bacterium]
MPMLTLDRLSADLLTPERKSALKTLAGTASARIPGEVYGCAGSAAAVMLAGLAGGKAPVIVVGDSLDDAGYLYTDLCHIAGEENVGFLPSGFRRDIKYGQTDEPARILRTETLRRLAGMADASTGKARPLRFVVTYPDALAEGVASRVKLEAATLSLRTGAEVQPSEIEAWLLDQGFNRVDYVYEPGQFAVRGSILDIFGYSSELPFRVDFFGDEIDSIRSFNVETQLSEQKLGEIAVTARLDQEGEGDERPLSLLDYIEDQKPLIAFRDEALATARIREIGGEQLSTSSLIADEGDPDAMKEVVDTEVFAEKLKSFRRLHFTSARDITAPKGAKTLNFDCSPQGIYHKNFDLIAESFKRLESEGYEIFILSDNDKQFDRLRVIFEDRGDNISFRPALNTLHEGFVDHPTRRCVFTDHQIFDRFHKYTLKSERARSGKMALSLKELGQIEPGDYVVHIDHGVGIFGGLVRTEVGGHMQELIKLVYANDDIALVSLHALHKLAKYRGKDGVAPKINRLGSGNWSKLKEKTKGKLKDIARDLIKLYAARKDEKGFAFSPDSYMQHELEASFIYEDTPDQLTATQAVKKDMESERPMDRLVCGDVGFGKTEVAIRAAFKAAADSKQVAVLVPTTVLASQHYKTFSERLKDFPVRVEYLTRARSAKETKEVLADLEAGKIDIIVGTHKLIGKGVKFKDLGLLIVDEEQKFGVAVKERLKQLKVNIDTLTMSATPIPRTLQFSLMGARDLSTIATAPPNRYPIITNVTGLSDDVVAEAINFELARGGQVFFVNNRIEGLFELEDMVKRLVPDARTVVAHGQMPPEKLEKAINDFTAHHYDVLLATTIIESGIDMPNVNTIIVNNAHKFGLSELHQLRGRVGRSSRKAFCYLAVPPGVPLTPIARRRLQAIESFSDLGAGIQIAMQDLDIRGAGNLLGAEQSGFIADLGYETYQKVLKEAVMELRTEEFADLAQADTATIDASDFVADCSVESDLELLLPMDYVAQESERIALYKELDSITDEAELQAFEERLRDRFGRIPEAAGELLLVPRLRRYARRLGIEKVILRQGKMFIYFVDESNRAYYQSPMFGRILNYVAHNARRASLKERNGRRSITLEAVPTVAVATALLKEILSLDSL